MGDGDQCIHACGPDSSDRALLHAELFLMWSEYNDYVDGLTMEMLRDAAEFQELQVTLNA